ncbi:hypothetical protein ABXS75_15590 [Roseburia hominis]
MAQIFEHVCLGFCVWDIPALLVIIAVIAGFTVRLRKLKKERKELEDRVSE